jgi:hypothetical protein
MQPGGSAQQAGAGASRIKALKVAAEELANEMVKAQPDAVAVEWNEEKLSGTQRTEQVIGVFIALGGEDLGPAGLIGQFVACLLIDGVASPLW